MLYVRVNGQDVAIPNAHDARLLEIAGAAQAAVNAPAEDAKCQARAEALADAARRGDIKTVKRLTRQKRV